MNRKDYMAKRVSHEEYYRELARLAGIDMRANDPIVIAARKALDVGDEHLNSIPLARWDRMAECLRGPIARANKEMGNGSVFSLSDGVCALKAAARKAAEEFPAAPDEDDA